MPYFNRQFHYADAAVSLDARVSITGHELARLGQYCWNGLKRGNAEFILWQYTISGGGLLSYDDATYQLMPGQAMVLKIPHKHCYQVLPEAAEWELAYIILRGNECLRIGEAIIDHGGPVSNHYCTPAVVDLAQKIILADSSCCSPYELSALAYAFMMSLSSEILSSRPRTTIPDTLKEAKRYALKHFSDGIDVSALASTANMSYAHFSREFTAVYGMAPGAFLLQLQMEKAVNLLQHSTKSIKEIAEDCGFSGASYFCRAFRQKFGSPPGVFRATR